MIRSHIIPQKYLAQFSSKEAGKTVLWTYEKGKSPRPGTPKSEAAENGYFRYTERSGDKNEKMEAILAGIESEAAEALSLLPNDCYDLRSRQREALAKYVAVMFVRSRARRDANARLLNNLRARQAELADDSLKMSDFARRYSLRMGREISPIELADSFRRVAARMGAPHEAKNVFIDTLLTTAEKIANELYPRQWQVWKTDGSPFITSDNPVVTIHQQSNGLFQLGWGFRVSAVLFPVSSSCCLLMGAAGPARRYVTNQAVLQVNKAIAMCMHRYAYARINSEDLSFLVDAVGGEIKYLENAFVPPPSATSIDSLLEDII